MTADEGIDLVVLRAGAGAAVSIYAHRNLQHGWCGCGIWRGRQFWCGSELLGGWLLLLGWLVVG